MIRAESALYAFVVEALSGYNSLVGTLVNAISPLSPMSPLSPVSPLSPIVVRAKVSSVALTGYVRTSGGSGVSGASISFRAWLPNGTSAQVHSAVSAGNGGYSATLAQGGYRVDVQTGGQTHSYDIGIGGADQHVRLRDRRPAADADRHPGTSYTGPTGPASAIGLAGTQALNHEIPASWHRCALAGSPARTLRTALELINPGSTSRDANVSIRGADGALAAHRLYTIPAYGRVTVSTDGELAAGLPTASSARLKSMPRRRSASSPTWSSTGWARTGWPASTG